MGVSVRGTSHGMSHCPMRPLDGMDSGTQHASVEGQVDIPWNVQLFHGTVGWDGRFTAFLNYGQIKHSICHI